MQKEARALLETHRREFIDQLAGALDRGRRMKALLTRLEELADPAGNRRVDQLTRHLRKIVETEITAMSVEVIDGEIVDRGLYKVADPEVSRPKCWLRKIVRTSR